MINKKIIFDDLGAEAKISALAPISKVCECHVLLQAESLENLAEAEQLLLSTNLSRFALAAKRIYAENPEFSTEAIGQKPLGKYQFAEWLYLKNCDGTHNGYNHLWSIGNCLNIPAGGPGKETKELLEQYESSLAKSGGDFARDCIRTWFYIKDIDTNYQDFVKARKHNFTKIGLTEKTHYITSTGICGTPSDPAATVQMDAYSVIGLEDGQLNFLYAPTHLNPTYEYGVTFERGTRIRYGDRSHIYISGTASINNKGEVLHVDDVEKQTVRMWENVSRLLEEADADFNDIAQIVVYIRNESDYETVEALFSQKFPETPYIITSAAVCRPTWLIEMECIALTEKGDCRFRDF